MNRSLNLNHLTLGVCYYPEHWDKSLWKNDLTRMKEYGIEVIRIAEFAWNKFEPHEGEFTFDFFDEFMDLALAEDMKIIFCTPTATPPAWMSQNYPEILNADVDGHLIHHGLRRQYTMNSPKYREFTARIVEKLAAHYSKYPNIILWQLDNEINCECDRYYSESDHKAYRDYVKKRFGTLETYNKEIGADFWNQTYTDWEEVHLPRRTNFGAMGNPHVDLLEKRFISDTAIGYLKLQADIIRKYSDKPITSNGLFGHLDYHKLVEDGILDFITYDNYPNFAFEKNLEPARENGLRDRNSSYNLTTTRSISPIFGIMEQQSGPSGWNFRMIHATPKPGRLRLWTLQAIAHGADFISYFRWRTCTFGTEIYWHGLHDYDNRPNRRITELCKTYRDIQNIQDLCGKAYIAEAAILKDYDNMWDGEEDGWHSEVDRISHDGWFRAFQKKHIPFDFKYITDDTLLEELLKYKLLVYPHPTIFTEKRATLLKAYAEAGGTVIFGCRTGYKKPNGICYMMPMPGYAAKLVGATVEEFTFLSPYDEAQFVTIDGTRVSAPCFNDILELTDGEAIGTFCSNYYAGKPAVSKKKLGKGKAYYFGGAFAEDTAKYFIEREGLTAPLGLANLLDFPEEIELAVRGEYVILLNYGEAAVTVNCNGTFKELITDTIVENQLVIHGVDAVVLKQLP